MLSQLRTTVVAPQPPTTTPTIITTGQSRPFQPHPTSASQQFARHTRPAAVLHASPAQQPVFPTPSPDHVFALATPQQSPTTAPRTTNEFVNNWTSVNQPSYSLPSPSAMAGGAASWTDAEKVRPAPPRRRENIFLMQLPLENPNVYAVCALTFDPTALASH